LGAYVWTRGGLFEARALPELDRHLLESLANYDPVADEWFFLSAAPRRQPNMSVPRHYHHHYLVSYILKMLGEAGYIVLTRRPEENMSDFYLTDEGYQRFLHVLLQVHPYRDALLVEVTERRMTGVQDPWRPLLQATGRK
jgi:hypothetical protein